MHLLQQRTRLHRRRTRTVQWYSPGGASVPSPHLIHPSLGPPEFKSQTASRSVRPSLHISRLSISILYNGRSPSKTQKCPFPWGIWTSYMILWVHPSPKPKQHLDRFSRFCRAHYRDRQTDRPRNWFCNNTYIVKPWFHVKIKH